jgi:hypothetical protein
MVLVILQMTPTLTLRARRPYRANQRVISPHARDFETSETSANGQISSISKTRSPGLYYTLTPLFYYTTTNAVWYLRIILSHL